jgi:O-succinylbenzoate synthase
VKVDRIVLRLVRFPLRNAFENRWERIENWTKLIVELHAGDSVGYGECMAMETPYYSYETIETAWLAIRRYLAKIVFSCAFEHPSEVARALSVISGHHEARGALECACWEMYARAHGRPRYDAVGGTLRQVSSGATVGVQGDIETALAAVAQASAEGYRRIKVKLKPGWDLEVVQAIRRRFPEITILGDANGAYGAADFDRLLALDKYEPFILEQPFPRPAWWLASALQARHSAPICLDESIECIEDVEHASRIKAARLINLKVGRVGGLHEAIRIHDRCQELGLPVFVGSKSETGIGRWLNIAFGTLPNVTYPSDVAASERYFTEEIVRDPIRLVAPGHVQPLPGPGIGTEIDPARLLKLTRQLLVLDG